MGSRLVKLLNMGLTNIEKHGFSQQSYCYMGVGVVTGQIPLSTSSLFNEQRRLSGEQLFFGDKHPEEQLHAHPTVFEVP